MPVITVNSNSPNSPIGHLEMRGWVQDLQGTFGAGNVALTSSDPLNVKITVNGAAVPAVETAAGTVIPSHYLVTVI